MFSNRSQLNLHSTLDLIEVVPMFAGYRPTDSLVALYANAAGFLARAARFDLSLDPTDLARTFDKLTQLCREHDGSQAQAVHLVAYSDDTQTADQVLLFIADNWGRDRTPADPTTVLATLATASADSWAEINPNHPSEPTSRTLYPAGTSELAADAVLAGMFQAYGTRDELAATVTAPQPDDAADFAAQVDSSTDTIGSPAGMAEWMSEDHQRLPAHQQPRSRPTHRSRSGHPRSRRRLVPHHRRRRLAPRRSVDSDCRPHRRDQGPAGPRTAGHRRLDRRERDLGQHHPRTGQDDHRSR